MKKGMKARPHDVADVVKLGAEVVEIHASSEDLEKNIEGMYAARLAVHLPEYDGQTLVDPASDDENIRRQAMMLFQRGINKAREWGEHFVGTPKVIVHPGGWSNEPKTRMEKVGLYESFFRTVTDLNKLGVDFLVENMPPNPWFYGGQWHCNIFMNPAECRDYCSGNGVGFCYDISHAFMYCNTVKGLTLDQYTTIVRPIIAHVHFSDAKGTDGEGLQIGEGELNLKEVMDSIGKLPVAWVCEVWQGHKDEYAGFKKAWEAVDGLLKPA